MNWATKGCVLLLLISVSCKIENAKERTHTLGDSGLVEATDLADNKASTDIKIIDFRKEEAYLKGHIPNAIRLWRDDIEAISAKHKGMMASRRTIEDVFSRAGIRSEDTLVVYDDNGSCDAARLWWVLKCYGFDRVKILNGGIRAWIESRAPLSKTLPDTEKTVFKLPDVAVSKHHIDRQRLYELLLDSMPIFVLDTRTPDEYSGKRHKSGAAKGGRIPNSSAMNWARTVDFKGTHKFKTTAQLADLYNSLQIPKNAEIVTYCHSGVRSAHTTFVLTELLGYKNVKNYDGSWSEWSHFEDLPFEKDSITVILH